MRVTFKVLDSLSTAPRHAANQDPQGPARMPPASRGPPPLGDPDRMVAVGIRAQFLRPGCCIPIDVKMANPTFGLRLRSALPWNRGGGSCRFFGS